MASGVGRSIELFFVDGTPTGMVTASIPFQWSGHVLAFSRTELPTAQGRVEVDRAGIYLLYGERAGAPLLYIGESDDLKKRLVKQAADREWWSKAILITSSGEPLNKAHIRYLEQNLISKVLRAGLVDLDNGQTEFSRSLGEAATAHMNDFLDNLYLVLPAMGFDFFTEYAVTDQPTAHDHHQEKERFEFVLQREKIRASAYIDGSAFVVEVGSKARLKWVGKTTEALGYAILHRELMAQGVLVADAGHATFAKSYRFKSSSAAAAVVSGRPASGPASWMHLASGKTLSEWEQETL